MQNREIIIFQFSKSCVRKYLLLLHKENSGFNFFRAILKQLAQLHTTRVVRASMPYKPAYHVCQCDVRSYILCIPKYHARLGAMRVYFHIWLRVMRVLTTMRCII